MSSINLTTSLPTSTVQTATVTASASRPPTPSPSPNDEGDDEGDMSDDETEVGDDQEDGDYHKSKPPPPSTLSATAFSSSTALVGSTSTWSDTFLTTFVATTLTTTSTSSSVTDLSTGAPAQTSQATLDPDADSTPINTANPQLETKANSSPLGTAGIVLASVFSFAALLTIVYLLFRLLRHRKTYRQRNPGTSRLDTFDSEASFEKGNSLVLPSTNQETGIIFGRGSSRSSREGMQVNQTQSSARGRSRFSFLNRRWYSTGTEVIAARQRNASIASSMPRWGAPFSRFGRRQSNTETVKSDSTTVMNEHYRPPHQSADTVDQPSADIQRTLSERSTGLGNARAYAHHHVRAPQLSARSTISSISSRWFKRKSDETIVSAAASSLSRDGSETNDMYRASTHSARSQQESRRSLQHAQMPRLPLPIALSGSTEGAGTRLSV